MKFNAIFNKVNNFSAAIDRPEVVYLLGLLSFFLAECKCQDGWVI
jgi:hypothetical protein